MVFCPLRQYAIAYTGTALAALNIPEIETLRKMNQQPQVRLFTRDSDVVAKFGDGAVAADRTVTSSAMVADNFTVIESVAEVFQIPSTATHVSLQSADGSATGTLYLTIGFNEGE